MSDSFFISDLHLSPKDYETRERYLSFCRDLIDRKPARLFLLGDIFNYWFNTRRMIQNTFKEVLQALYQLAESGTEVHYFIGNHDFLFRSIQGIPSNFQIYLKGRIFQLGHQKFYLTHGDDLCRSDWIYRLTKPLIRSKALELLSNILPEAWPEKIAEALSASSRQIAKRRDQKNLKISLPYCLDLIKEHSLDGIIHGHIHENSFQPMELEGNHALLLSVGPWREGKSPVWRYCEDTAEWKEFDANL